jgi:hypothetical protein
MASTSFPVDAETLPGGREIPSWKIPRWISYPRKTKIKMTFDGSMMFSCCSMLSVPPLAVSENQQLKFSNKSLAWGCGSSWHEGRWAPKVFGVLGLRLSPPGLLFGATIGGFTD